ncbi:hypothetical protein ACWGKW_00335 [Streptomyces sp. NPDC054766]|uniref:hypothetical protein n=1 Tax=Streptomyces rhizosphaerihabitans TaxID=1266770 RepID=UPI0021C1041B|nr:hypothetical protein [Streptomyces rhizosphaerihabitans]MCT9006053.1 hypothetical protein [Streptomyces rhizosphaerihabitans]
MSQPVPPEQSESTPEQSESTPAKSSGKRLPRLPQLGRSRWLALGVGVVLVGGAVAGAAVVAGHEHGEKGDRMHIQAAPGWKGGAGGERRVLGEDRGESGFRNDESRMRQNTESRQDGENGQSGLAPAPVPTVSAAKAIEAAAKAVPGGKPDALRVVVQQGGGSGWEVEVLGTDGVRHLVTLDGATGAVTGNTVASAAPVAGR